jgi:esterase/lipase superfamily enzyme
MKREYVHWYSPSLHRSMELLVFGEGGARVLVFPTREGRFFEYENLGLVESLRHRIEAGSIQLICVEGLANEIFYASGLDAAMRIARWQHFETYILEEVLPFMDEMNSHPETVVTGCSLGAYYAANIAFRNPDTFTKLVALSGRYDLTHAVECFESLLPGEYGDHIYFNMPCHYLPNLNDPEILRSIRKMKIQLVVGDEDPFIENNRQLSRILCDKGVGHELNIWRGRAHRGSSWRLMVGHYL